LTGIKKIIRLKLIEYGVIIKQIFKYIKLIKILKQYGKLGENIINKN